MTGVADATQPPRLRQVLTAIVLAMAMAALTSSIVGPAMPVIVGELGRLDLLPWVASATLLTLTVSTPVWATLSDRFGRRRPFHAAMLLFVAAALLAGLAQDMGMLIAARAVQGVGAGGLMVLAQILLADVLPPRQRGRYNGLIGAALLVPMVGGPVLGGVLVGAADSGWRWCFLINVPVGLVAVLLNRRALPADAPAARRTPFDWPGALTITGAAGAAMLVMTLGGSVFAWGSVWSWTLGAIAVVLAALAVHTQTRAAAPILPPWLFTRRTVVFGVAASALVGAAMYGAMIYLPQYLQFVAQLSPTASGLMMVPLIVGLMATLTASGLLVSRTGRWKVFALLGTIVLVPAFVVLALLDADAGLVLVGVGIALVGCGLGAVMQMLLLAAQNEVGEEGTAAVTAAVTFFRSLGGALGVSLLGAVFAHRLRDGLASAEGVVVPERLAAELELGTPEQVHDLSGLVHRVVLEALTAGMQGVFLGAACLAALGTAAVLAMRGTRLRSTTATDR
jgi:EmrB/QacA subfamily drug resistance transporter